MKTASKLLNDKKEQYARLMADEMGKPLAQGRSEVEKCAWCCDFYADNAEKFLSPEVVQTDASRSYVTFNPLGVVLAVMPWNFPFWQVFRFAAPGLMAGNAGILKHASNVPGCALAIEEIFHNAEFPENLPLQSPASWWLRLIAPGISRWSAAKSSSVRTSIRAGMLAVPINRESLSGDIVV